MQETIPSRPSFRPALSYGPLRLSSRYLLSPLARYTTLAFRRIVRELGGVGLATTDLVNVRGLLAQNKKSLELIESCSEDRPLAVQIFGNDEVAMRDAAQFLEGRGIESIDINMGCPVARITKDGCGAGMMCHGTETVSVVRAVVEAVSIPVTVKMRLGWDASQITAPDFARAFEQVGVAAVAIHGRTRAQGFGGSVDLGGIRRVVEAVEQIPVIGNGDVRTVADAARMLRETGCHGVSMGRGALANPWIFRQLNEWEKTGTFMPAGNFQDRMRLLRKQFGFLEERFGSGLAVVRFRRMGHWYLKSMRVAPPLRHQFQLAKTKEELEATLETIANVGPRQGTKTGILPDMHIPVPSGPVDRW